MSEKGWKRHFQGRMFSLEHDDPTRFVHGPWRRINRVSTPFLVYRILLSLILIGFLIWSLVVNWATGKWFIYFTHWGFGTITIQATLGAVLVAMEYRNQRSSMDQISSLDINGGGGMPLSYKIYWILYNITLPCALFITILYWALVYNPKNVPDGPSDLNFVMHVGNSVAALVELIIGGLPSRLLHGLQPLFFAISYLAFNGIYYAAGGTDPKGNPWVYEVLNWSNGAAIATLIASSAILILLLHLFITLMAGLRSLTAKRLTKSSQRLSNWITPQTLSTGTFNKAFIVDNA